MAGFNSIPAASGGGGGIPSMNFVGSVHMETYNRSWAQGGTAGYYAVYSANQESGYAYFVGSGSNVTGMPLNRMSNVSHAFTSIKIIAPTNDLISLYKVKVKSTTAFDNPFTAYPGISSFPSIIRSSGNFVLPNNALPLVNVLLVGGGGAAFHHGGGGGGGGVVKLTAYQAVGTTSVTIGSANNSNGSSSPGGTTYFGSVYAIGGGSAGTGSSEAGGNGANGAGASSHNQQLYSGGTGITQSALTGLGATGAPVYVGGYTGGSAQSPTGRHVGGSGAGAGGNGVSRINATGGTTGGPGHQSDITGSNLFYAFGGSGSDHHGASSAGNANPTYAHSSSFGYGHGAPSYYDNRGPADSGAVVVRYYIA
jgi:hypothetical protein